MEIVLFFAYLTASVLMIAQFVMCLLKKAKWRNLIIFQIAALLVAVLLSFLYEHFFFQTPPNGDSLWRLRYLGEIVFSRIAIWVFSIMLAITAFIKLVLIRGKQD